MPRAVESKESQILKWFRHAPLSAALLLKGLIHGELRDRVAERVEARPAPKPTTRRKRRAAPKPPTKQRPKARATRRRTPKPAPAAQVESFDPNEE